MSIRTLIRIAALSVGLLLASASIWLAAGQVLLVAALGLFGLSLVYLGLLTRRGDLTQWQLRYHLSSDASQEDMGRLEQVLHFLADRTGHFVLEANARGLFLELPPAFGRYIEAQLPRALPEVKLSQPEDNAEGLSTGSFFLCTGSPNSDLLRWATEDRERQVRLHIHQGPCTALIAQTDGTRPPGRSVRLPLSRLLRRVWYRLPLWDDLSLGIQLSSLFPPTDDVTVYSSRSRLHKLIPPDDYHADSIADGGGRVLGESTDGRTLTTNHDVPLFTVGTPSTFLAQQVLSDLEAGWAVVVVSPHRSVLDRIARQAAGVPVNWLDPQYGHRSAHLALVSAADCDTSAMCSETVIEAAETFLADLGVDIALPAVGTFCRHLIRALVTSAQDTGQDLAFTDLHAVSRSTGALGAFLTDMHSPSNPDAQELLAQLDDEAGYVQAVTILSAVRAALKPLRSGPLQALCQPPFLNADQALKHTGLLLVPMTNDDFPEHDRLLSAMLDLTLQQLLANGDDVRLAMHLHNPFLYRHDHGQRWIDAAQQDTRLSLLLDVQQPERYQPREGSQVIFRCSDALASCLIHDWHLPASPSDLTELPADTAVARLPGMVVTLKVKNP